MWRKVAQSATRETFNKNATDLHASHNSSRINILARNRGREDPVIDCTCLGVDQVALKPGCGSYHHTLMLVLMVEAESCPDTGAAVLRNR